MPRNFPLRSIVKPSDLNGVTNGNIPAELLVDVGRRNSKMHHLAARGWRCLMWHFEQAGFEWDLASIDPRTYQRQCEMFDGRKYPGGRYLPQSMWAAWEAGGGKWGLRDNGTIQQYTWTAQDRTSSEQWRRMAPNAMAAVPGTSPHGWALAVDLATQLDDDTAAESITEDQVRFLMANDLALNCGFAWSTTSEPWHLQWFVGDHVPTFVIDWEQSQEAPVVIPPNPIFPEVPTVANAIQYAIYKPTDCDAQFLGLPDEDGNTLFVVWVDKQRADAWQSVGVQVYDQLSFGGFINCVLFGRIPTGDSRHAWTGAEFFQVVA